MAVGMCTHPFQAANVIIWTLRADGTGGGREEK